MSPLAADLHQFLDDFPQALSRERKEELRAECQRLMARFQVATDHRLAAMSAHLQSLSRALEESKHAALAHYETLCRSYEHWAKSQNDRAVGGLRPLIRARTLFHIFMALVGFACYQFFFGRTGCLVILGSLLSIFTTLEIVRRISPRFNHFLLQGPLFRPIARPDEYYRINSASYYLLALSVITFFFSREAVMAAVLILGFADPAAAWLGKKYGKTKLYKRKSIVGTSVFFVVGFVCAFAYFLFLAHASLGMSVSAAFVAALFGAAAELFSTRLDDNLTVPLAAAVGAAFFL